MQNSLGTTFFIALGILVAILGIWAIIWVFFNKKSSGKLPEASHELNLSGQGRDSRMLDLPEQRDLAHKQTDGLAATVELPKGISRQNSPMVVPDHVFISYSTNDGQLARELVKGLKAAGIPIWIDSSRLSPGTPDWELAIRDAISRSCAVIVLASPESSRSRFVRAELALAESIGCQIYPVWLQGERWVDCVPLGLSAAQYIDLRGDQWTQGLEVLAATLSRKMAELQPDHYLVAPLRQIREDKRSVTITTVSPPRGYFSIELPSGTSNEVVSQLSRDPGRAAFFCLSKFHTVWDFLDVLFINYLAGDFQPYTYGRDWVLRESRWNCGRVLANWSWLISVAQKVTQDNREYGEISLEAAGIEDRSMWQVSTVGSFTPVGLALKEPELFDAIRDDPKTFGGLRHSGVIKDVPIMEVDPLQVHRFVIWFNHMWGPELKCDSALEQATTDPSKIEFWLKHRRRIAVGERKDANY